MSGPRLPPFPVKSVTIDGEGVVCGSNGVSDFELLRAAVGRKGARNAFLYAFDLLELDGVDLRCEPWETRRTTLAGLLRKTVHGIQLSEHIESTDGLTIFGHACRMGLEGIVAKRRTSPIAQAGLLTGSRSKIRTRQLRRELWNGDYALRGGCNEIVLCGCGTGGVAASN